MLTTRRRPWRLPVAAAGALALTAGVAPAASAADGDVTIDLYGINDFHGRIEAGSYGVAGAAVLAGAIGQFRAANPNTLFVSAGDNVGASTFTSFIQDDNPTIDALNAAGLDVSALGNHEFDKGRTDVDDHLAPRADFPYLAANLVNAGTDDPAYDPYWVTDVDGVRVGFVGAVTEYLPELVSPAGISTLRVAPIVDSVNAVADQLSDGDTANGEADVVVLLVHEGPDSPDLADSTDDSVFGTLVAGLDTNVDAVFSGHTHQAFAHQIPVDGWPAGLTRPVVQSGSYGVNVDHVQLVVDPVTKTVTSNSSEVLPLAGNYPADPTVQAIVDDAVAAAEGPGSVSLGDITADLKRAVQSGGTENRGGESTLGNLVADVQLWAGQSAGGQIAFMNPGGLRQDLLYASSGEGDPDGNVTYREAADVQPFANTLVAENLTGAQVLQVLEEQWQPDGASRPFLKLGVAGLTYTYDPTAAAGSHITQAWVGDQPLDTSATYRVIANSFLAAGGDNFATLADGSEVTDTGQIDLQAMVAYLGEKSPVSPDLAQRSVGVVLPEPPTDGYLPGSTLSVDLSSLLFSNAEGQGDTVVLTVDGQQVGTATIDPSIVDTTDESGRATVELTVPADAEPGPLAVAVSVPSTGTTSSFTIPVAFPCTVQYQTVQSGWTFLSSVRVTNDTDATVQGWKLTWDWTNHERVRFGIGATVRQRGSHVTALAPWWNPDLSPGESATFLMLGKARHGLVEPATVELNGQQCAIEH
ncbi:5'-nucleotidase C-terminal domain-containing protein [Isoptericola sp. b490]|uniref:5'-nucleotidase C-terminal domain-containing protein n=1 Tax=Actinotalea lenta TaxID=3064654 RepID=UPI002713BD84|nr:5'-nucleotidase C-terminal domain-containing protein [Isoptericola sp. b490]MDO8122603.1 5'-nucleotidase C-terminal domain-containing protein [Isoptericola sp. b490]